MQKILEKIVKWTTAISFIMPLFFFPYIAAHFIFPFIVPKVLLFRTIVLIMLGAFVLLLVSARAKYKVAWTPITLSLSLFLISFLLSTFLGVDWYHSFWDNHERMLGLFTLIHYFLYYLIATTVIREEKDWKFLLRFVMVAASLVMLVGVLQRTIFPDLLLNGGNSRVSATLGNPIYLGGYGLFLSFLGAYMFFKEEKKRAKIYSLVAAVLGIVGLFLSSTRGSFLGLVAGAVVLFVWYALTWKEYRKKLFIIGGTVAAVGILALGILYVNRQNPTVQNLPVLGSLLNTTLSGGTAGTRLMAWGIAVDAWKEKPVFGWGPNNFFYAFNKYYRPEFLEHGWGETWFDNAHNIIMNTLAVQGLFGVLTYLAVFGVVGTVAVKSYKKKTLDIHTAGIALAFLSAHLVQNIFVFENPTSYLYFFFFLAFLNAQMISREKEEAQTSKVGAGVQALVWVVIALVIYITNVNPARANMAVLKAIGAAYTGAQPLEAYQNAIKIPSPHIDDIRNDFARAVIQRAPAYVEDNRKDEAAQLVTLAYNELQKNRTLHPMDIRVHLQQAQTADIAVRYVGQVDKLFEAEATIQEALTYSPKRQQLFYMLSVVKLQVQKPDEAIKLLNQAIDLDPKIGEGWWRLAVVYKATGKEKEMRDTIQKAFAAKANFDEQGLAVIREIAPDLLPK